MRSLKTSHYLALLALLVAGPTTSLALISVGEVTREGAEELGIELRAKPGGPNHAWIELEFKPEGRLSKFQKLDDKPGPSNGAKKTEKDGADQPAAADVGEPK